MKNNNKSNKSKSCYAIGLINILLFFSAPSYSQTPIDVNSLNASYVSANSTIDTSIAKTPCAGALNCGETYTDSFNASDGTNQGDLVLNPIASFSLSAIPYNLRSTTTNISYQRVSNPIATTTGVDLIQYENGDIDNSGAPNNSVNLLPSKRSNSIDALKGQVINTGNESIFHNYRTSFQLVNTDVERIDIIFASGVKTATPQNAGFLIIERGGNDKIKVAAITSLSTIGTPTGYGTLASISNTDWATGMANQIRTISYVSDDNGVNYGVFGANGAQDISANFMSFQDLGVVTDQVIYGYSIFPGDVDPIANPSQILTDPDSLPKNTAGLDGGLDLLYASGAFDSDNKLINLQVVQPVPSLSTYGLFILVLMFMSVGIIKKTR